MRESAPHEPLSPAILDFRTLGCYDIVPVSIEGNVTVKQIVAVVKPYLAEKVLEALKRAPLEALSVHEVMGFGRQKSYLDEYGSSEYSQAFLPKVQITLWVDDARSEEILRKIVGVARTGRMGDGKVFVVPIESYETINIATDQVHSE